LLVSHEKMTIHSKRHLSAYIRSADTRNNRNSDSIDTAACVHVLAGMLQCAIFEKWVCPTCPIGITVRCNEIYANESPSCTYDDYSDVLLCRWFCHRLTKLVSKMGEFSSFLPHIDLPEAENKDKSLKDKPGYTHRKSYALAVLTLFNFLTKLSLNLSR
jgi:hypothetical protein